jgi:hypothetical protein
MLKDSDIAGYSTRRTHRTYTPEFKAELVAACQQPGVSIAALANSHAMNAVSAQRTHIDCARQLCCEGFLALRLPAVRQQLTNHAIALGR